MVSALLTSPSSPSPSSHSPSSPVPRSAESLQPACAFRPAVCKYVALELKSAFEETGKTKEVIDTKYGFLDGKGSAVKYTQS